MVSILNVCFSKNVINYPTLALGTAEGWYVLTDSWNYYISVTHGKVLHTDITVADDITAMSSMYSMCCLGTTALRQTKCCT